VAERRAKGDGALYKRKDGRWVGEYDVETDTGRKRRYVYGKTRKEAAKKLREAMADRDAGFTFDAVSLTLSDYLTQWLNDSVRGSVKASTFAKHEIMVRVHILPVLGQVKMKALTPTHMQRLYRQKLDAGLSLSSVECIHRTLSKALRTAVRWSLISCNPCLAVDPSRPTRAEIRPLNAEHVKVLLRAAKDNPLFALYQTAITTGLRMGELLGLCWDDLDMGRGVLRVNRTLTRIKGGPSFDSPKSAKGQRSVRLTPATVAALDQHRQRQREAGLWKDDGLVFCSRNGTPLNPSNVRNRSFRPLLRKAGLPDTTFHAATRHTCATLLLAEGVHPKVVQELLEHAQITLTLDTYSHVLPDMQAGAVEAMQDVLEEDDR
jgi:integrase